MYDFCEVLPWQAAGHCVSWQCSTRMLSPWQRMPGRISPVLPSRHDRRNILVPLPQLTEQDSALYSDQATKDRLEIVFFSLFNQHVTNGYIQGQFASVQNSITVAFPEQSSSGTAVPLSGSWQTRVLTLVPLPQDTEHGVLV